MRVLGSVCTAVVLAAAPVVAEPHVGYHRFASSSASVRGSDGVLYRFDVDLIATGWPSASADRREARIRLSRCRTTARCSEIGSAVKDVTKTYNETFDTSITAFATRVGKISIIVQWDAPAGWGWSPTPAAGADAANVTTTSAARAAFVLQGKSWFVRCFDKAARVGVVAGAATAPPWQASKNMQLPRGLRGQLEYRLPTCA